MQLKFQGLLVVPKRRQIPHSHAAVNGNILVNGLQGSRKETCLSLSTLGKAQGGLGYLRLGPLEAVSFDLFFVHSLLLGILDRFVIYLKIVLSLYK